MSYPPVYLSGPIQNRPWEDCGEWRVRATNLLTPWQPIRNPMRRGFDRTDYTSIVEGDLQDIRECRAVLAKVDTPSFGTSMEIRFAAAELKIPVYVWYIGESEKSPWLIYHTTRFFVTLEDACAYLLAEIKE